MPTFTNHTGNDLDFTALDLKIKAGDTFTVTDADAAEGLRVQGFPEASDSKKTTKTNGDS